MLLPNELLSSTYSYLDFQDLCNVPLVCKHWNQEKIWHLFSQACLPKEFKAPSEKSSKAKVLCFLKELKDKVDFVLNNPETTIYIYPMPKRDPLFSPLLIKDLNSRRSLQWKVNKIKECINNITFMTRPVKLAPFKLTTMEDDDDLKELDILLKLGFEVNSPLPGTTLCPTALFTFIHHGLSETSTVTPYTVFKRLIDYGLDLTVKNSEGKTVRELPEIKELLSKMKIS